MSSARFFLVSLPTSISQSNDRDEALTTLRSTVTTDLGTTVPFNIPTFKIGTLDALVQQADDLAKLERDCQGVVSKVADSLRSILEGDEEKIAEQKTVNDSEMRSEYDRREERTDMIAQDLWKTTFSLSRGTRSSIAQTSRSLSCQIYFQRWDIFIAREVKNAREEKEV